VRQLQACTTIIIVLIITIITITITIVTTIIIIITVIITITTTTIIKMSIISFLPTCGSGSRPRRCIADCDGSARQPSLRPQLSQSRALSPNRPSSHHGGTNKNVVSVWAL
jgi:hypothetical protein